MPSALAVVKSTLQPWSRGPLGCAIFPLNNKYSKAELSRHGTAALAGDDAAVVEAIAASPAPFTMHILKAVTEVYACVTAAASPMWHIISWHGRHKHLTKRVATVYCRVAQETDCKDRWESWVRDNTVHKIVEIYTAAGRTRATADIPK